MSRFVCQVLTAKSQVLFWRQTGGKIPAAVSFPMASCEAGRRRRFRLHPWDDVFFANLAEPFAHFAVKVFTAKVAKNTAKDAKRKPSLAAAAGYARRPGRSETQLLLYAPAKLSAQLRLACQGLANRCFRQRGHDLVAGRIGMQAVVRQFALEQAFFVHHGGKIVEVDQGVGGAVLLQPMV